MKLDKADLRSSLWIRLSAHLNERLEEERVRNDGRLNPEETSRLRGRIAQLKEILALAEQEPVQPDATDEAASMSVDPMGIGFIQEQP